MLALLLGLCGCATPKEELGFTDLGAWTPITHLQVAFSPDGRYLAAVNRKLDSVVVFDTTSGKEAWHFRPKDIREFRKTRQVPRRSGMAGLGFTSDGRVMAVSWLQNEQIGIWDASRSNLVAQLPCPKGSRCLSLSPDGEHVASEGSNNTLVISDTSKGQPNVQGTLENRPAGAFFSPRSRYLAAFDRKDVTYIWDAHSGEQLHKLPKPEHGFTGWLAFSPDETSRAISAKDVQVWRLDAWTNSLSIGSPKMKAGSRIAGGAWMFLAALGAHPMLTAAAGPNAPAGPATFSPDGRYVAVISSAASLGNALGIPEMQVRIFAVDTGELLSTLNFGNEVVSAAFNPDGTRLATAGHGVQLWDWRARRLIPSK